jgi:H+/Cl- antiporter ClcA
MATGASSRIARPVSDGLHLLRWIVLGAISGVLAGVSSWVFLRVLDEVTDTRVEEPWLLYLLPVAGLVVGVVYHRFGGRSAQGNSLLIDQIHEPTDWVPRRMAPLVLVGTWVTHLFGGSAGREGTALQMSGSLTDATSRLFRLPPEDRRILLAASLGGGFGAVFGVPLAGAVFAMEVQSVGRLRYEAIVPALTAALVGDLVVESLGYEHTLRPQIAIDLDARLALRVAVAGVAFGLAGAAFAWLTHRIKEAMARLIRFAPACPAIGGVAVVGLALLFGRDYLGLSLPLVDDALAGDSAGIWVFALKILFTAITLGAGFPGGEVTPLFVIGTTLGSALADPLGLDPVLLAAVGFVAVFAGAANVPLACTIMGVELFGAGPVVPLAIGCVVAYVCSGHQGIYTGQRIDTPKRPVRR